MEERFLVWLLQGRTPLTDSVSPWSMLSPATQIVNITTCWTCAAHLERCGVRRLEINVTPAPDGLADVDLLTVDNPLAVEPPP